MTLLHKALEFAIEKHKGQKRKYTGEDYYWHCVEVSDYVAAIGGTIDMQIAALLHDTLEDTNTEYEEIGNIFGWKVADMVVDLTDVSKASDGNRKVRKEIDRQHTAKACIEAKTIKLADLISNTKSIIKHDKDFAKVYIKEKELLLEVLTEGDKTLYSTAQELLKEARKELNEHS